jgi:Family of unknown function (DUF5670)
LQASRENLVFPGASGAKEKNMLWTIFVVLLVLWLLGFTLHIGGALIHLLIVVAVVVLIFNLVTGSRRAWWSSLVWRRKRLDLPWEMCHVASWVEATVEVTFAFRGFWKKSARFQGGPAAFPVDRGIWIRSQIIAGIDSGCRDIVPTCAALGKIRKGGVGTNVSRLNRCSYFIELLVFVEVSKTAYAEFVNLYMARASTGNDWPAAQLAASAIRTEI